jgi:predicted DNA-binding transcriptional regulator YafY
MSEIKRELDRALSILAVASSRPEISLGELAKRTHAEESEVANDLFGTLSMCGTPPYLPHDYISCTLEGDRVTVRFADQFRRPISLNALEALSLKLAIESLTPPDEPTPKVVVDLLKKIEEGMSHDHRARFRALAKSVVAKVPGAGGPILACLRDAVRDRVEVDLSHVAPGRKTARRVVRPLGLLSRSGVWYLVAHDVARDRVSSFRLDRIHAARATGAKFEPPSGFQLEAFARSEPFAKREGQVDAVVRFRGPSARWIKEIAEAGTLKESGDDVVWHAPLGSEAGFAAFLLGIGADFVVEKPESLATCVAEMLGRVVSAHGAPARPARKR